MTDTRVARILKVLAAAPKGLTTAAIMDALAENITPRRTATRHYHATLRHCAAVGEVKVAGKVPAAVVGSGPARNVWRITAAGRRRVPATEAAMQNLPDAVLRGARLLFGPGTPAPVRRQAAAVLRDAGYTASQIGEDAFGLSAQVARDDLRGTLPGGAVPDVSRALEEIARRAGETRQRALREARERIGPGTSRPIRRETAAILRDLGCQPRDIGKALGVPAAQISGDLAGRQPGSRPGDPIAAIRGIGRRAEQARREAREEQARQVEAAQRARLAQQALDDARARYGPGTLPAVRREAAATLHGLGIHSTKIARVFGVTAQKIRQDLYVRDAPPPPAGLPDADALISLVRKDGAAVLDAYAPAVDTLTSELGAVAWLGISPGNLKSRRGQTRADGSPAWPEGDNWSYRTLVLHLALVPPRGPGPRPSTALSARGRALEDQIRTLMADGAGEGELSTSEIVEKLGMKPWQSGTVMAVLNRLATRGEVRKLKRQGDRRAYWQPAAGASSPQAGCAGH